jgi:dsDNA-specific endonuclease/ATPase MutS2
VSDLWSEATAAATGIGWLLEAIAPASAYGRRARERERPYRRGDEARARTAIERVARTAHECSAAQLDAIANAIGSAPEIATAIERARAGGTLADADFFELGRFFDALDDVGAQVREAPSLAGVAPAADGLAELRAQLAPGRSSERSFYLADALAPELAAARDEARHAQAVCDRVRSQARDTVARQLGLDTIRDGEFTLAREHATALPANVRVLREGATYLLCRLEPDDDELRALGGRDAAEAVVAECEERVRKHLSASVAGHANVLDGARETFGELDALVARARFAQRYACTVPQLSETASASLTNFRYLPLDARLRDCGRSYAPISFALDGVAVVTGPNMGGKTAALRALGFAVACVALGLPVPATAARLPLVDSIAWLGLDASREEAGLLSSFAREVVGLRELLAAPRAARALVLVDEFARTTSPREGRALTIALVRTLVQRGALALVATHYTGVAAAANVAHFASGRLRPLGVTGPDTSLAAALARIAAGMEYGLVPVGANDVPEADALALAEALGLDPALVALARDAL